MRSKHAYRTKTPSLIAPVPRNLILPPVCHEILWQGPERGERLGQIALRFSQDNFMPSAENLYYADMKAELSWNPHCLAVATFEGLGFIHGLPSSVKYVPEHIYYKTFCGFEAVNIGCGPQPLTSKG
jgi:hypothetical protein